MGLILGDTGADCILATYFNNTRPAGGNNLTMKLFTNDIVPLDTHTAATYTEAVGGGYAVKTLTCGSWTLNPVTDPSEITYAKQVFTFSGPLTGALTIYGYEIVDADNVHQWSERLTNPFTPNNDGDHLDITPKFQGSKGTPT